MKLDHEHIQSGKSGATSVYVLTTYYYGFKVRGRSSINTDSWFPGTNSYRRVKLETKCYDLALLRCYKSFSNQCLNRMYNVPHQTIHITYVMWIVQLMKVSHLYQMLIATPGKGSTITAKLSHIIQFFVTQGKKWSYLAK